MMRIGVRCDAMIELPDAWRRLPGIHICRLSPSETIEALDICIYLFSDGRAGLSQAVTEMSSTDQTKFCVFDQNYEEDIAILLVKAGCHGYSLYDAIDKLQSIVSTLSSGSYWVPRSVMEKVVEEITVDRDAIVGSLCGELSPREHEVARWIGRGLTNKRIAREMGVTERTVKAHLSNIFQKTPVNDRLELALLMKGELPERVRINLQ
ncbi:MAG: LuxR C-terminal-related transcriptional regulator [Litorivicinaceae bacterium]|jgi:DNA-binding NarL/FixJ family response regulator